MPSNFCRQINYPALGQLIQRQAEAPFSPKLAIPIPALLDSSDCDKLAILSVDDGHSCQPLILKRLIWELNSAGVLQRLEKLAATQPLIPDSGLKNSGLMTASQAFELLQQQPSELDHQETGLNWAGALLLAISDTIVLPRVSEDQAITLLPGDGCLISSSQTKSAIPMSTKNNGALLIHYYSLQHN